MIITADFDLPGSSSSSCNYSTQYKGTNILQDRSLFSIIFFLQYMAYSTYGKIFFCTIKNSEFRISLHLAGSKRGYILKTNKYKQINGKF